MLLFIPKLWNGHMGLLRNIYVYRYKCVVLIKQKLNF